jgi:hypothetical protein
MTQFTRPVGRAGRRVCSSDETQFYFEDEPTRALRSIHP